MAPKGDGDNAISLEFPNKSRIVGLPGNEATTRGFSAVSLLLVDEAARVTRRPVQGDQADAGGERREPVADEHAVRKAGVLLGGLGTRRAGVGADLRVTATECPRITQEFLEEEMANMGEQWFRQEYLCEFVDTVSGVFDRDLVERAISEEFVAAGD